MNRFKNTYGNENTNTFFNSLNNMATKKLTPERRKEVIALAKTAIGNIWSHPKGPRGGRDEADENCCEYCGKPVGGKKNTRYVHVLTNGKILPNEITDEEVIECAKEIGDQSQGCFAIGSECAKKLLGKNIDKYSEYGS